MKRYETVYQMVKKESHLYNMKLLPSPYAELSDIFTTHEPTYATNYMNGKLSAAQNRKIGFPWSEAFVYRTRYIVGGTVASVHDVLSKRAVIAGNLAGGTHHAFREHGEGYCIFNDIGIAANVAKRVKLMI